MLFCGSSNVVKNGVRGRKQMYKCKDCNKQFIGGQRRRLLGRLPSLTAHVRNIVLRFIDEISVGLSFLLYSNG